MEDFKIEPSKFGGDRLTLQITYREEKRIVWTNSLNLREMAQEAKDKFGLPFKTKIIKEEKAFLFT